MRAPRSAKRGASCRRIQTPANESLLGSRGPKAGVRGIPSPFINSDERGRDTPHPCLLPLLPRKDLFDEVLEGEIGPIGRDALSVAADRTGFNSRSGFLPRVDRQLFH